MSKPQLLSGARGEIQVGDQVFALATDININVRENVSTSYVVGSLNPVALDPTSIDVDVSVGRIVPVSKTGTPGQSDDSYKSTGSYDKISAIDLSIEQKIENILTAEDFTIAIRDKVTGKILASVKHCRFAGRSLGTGAEDVASERYNFVGIYDAGFDGSSNSASTGYES